MSHQLPCPAAKFRNSKPKTEEKPANFVEIEIASVERKTGHFNAETG
jgi:hypothetical protein